MSLGPILLRAQALVKKGQIEAALKIYKGLLVTFPNHPQVNTELGVLLLHHRPAQEAIKPLEKAVSALPKARELCVCLLLAHQRCGNLDKAREVLATMRQRGYTAAELAVFEKELSVPPQDRLDAIEKLMAQKSFVSAEIAARLLHQDFPGHEAVERLLQEVLAQVSALKSAA